MMKTFVARVIEMRMNRTGLMLALAIVLGTAGALRAETPADAPKAVDAPKLLPPEQVLYQYLLSEIAGQRGVAGLAWQGMIDLARKTHDARIARRAVELAFQARQFDGALDATLLWAELEPSSPGPRQALGVLAGSQGGMETVSQNVAKWIADGDKRATVFLQLPGILARYPEKDKAAALVRELAKTYTKLPEANWAIAQSALIAGELDTAIGAADAALAARPGWGHAALTKAQALREKSESAAIEYLQKFVEQFPADSEARLGYARMLASQKSLLMAREQFRRLASDLPDDIEMRYAVALISQQIEDYADAEAQYRKVLTMSPRDTNPVYFNLGLVGEGRKDVEVALSWYRQVGEGEYFVPAQLKIATLIAKRDGLAEGRKFLSEARAVEIDSPDVRNQLILAEVQLLRDAKDFAGAFTLLNDSIAKSPDAADLLYDRAMIAEKLDKLDVLEADLKRVIELQPDRSHAYNALGYTLAERNIRLEEARTLIEKAVKLSPEDAFIQDSLGWLQFRQGQIGEALNTLQRAYQTRRDAEIAAHLGEVLWASGKREEARTLWQKALAENPGSEALIAVMEKFKQ
jgi:tetratricopeptide (TPR) repeat protein